MRIKIFMLVGVVISAIFFTSSAFADVSINVEKVDMGDYALLKISAENDRSKNFEIGIKTLEWSDIFNGEVMPVKRMSTTDSYGEKGIPQEITSETRFIEGGELETTIKTTITGTTKWEPDADKDLYLITDSTNKVYQGEPIEENLIKTVTFSEATYVQGRITSYTEMISHTGGTGGYKREVSASNLYVQPLYTLHQLPGISTVDIGCLRVGKLSGGEQLAQNYTISIPYGKIHGRRAYEGIKQLNLKVTVVGTSVAIDYSVEDVEVED